MKLSHCFYSFLFASALCGGQAQAQSISADVLMELQSESGADSSNDDNHRTNMFFRTEVAPTLTLNDHFYIDGTLVLEPVRDPEPGDDLFFEDEGIYAEEIKLNFVHGPWHVFAGKFNPAFGFGWEWGAGSGVKISPKITKSPKKSALAFPMPLKPKRWARIH